MWREEQRLGTWQDEARMISSKLGKHQPARRISHSALAPICVHNGYWRVIPILYIDLVICYKCGQSHG